MTTSPTSTSSLGVILAAVAGAGLLVVVLLGAVGGALGATNTAAPVAGVGCVPAGGRRFDDGDRGLFHLDADQLGNAAVIVGVAKGMRLPERAAVIAIATALQESGLRNLGHGDRDSLGLFQQRPSQGWGTPQQVLDPTHAARRFYARLVRVPGWRTRPLAEAAQAVQRSAYPDAYARWEHLAWQIADHPAARGCPARPPDGGLVGPPRGGGPGVVAAQAALAQLGVPYSWGGGGATGPSRGIDHGAGIVGFDCSGLTQYAWARAGVGLPGVSRQQWQAGTPVPPDQLRPGDLVFFAHRPDDPTTIYHVGIYLSGGRMIHAPRTGQTVRVETFAGSRFWAGQYAGARRPGG